MIYVSPNMVQSVKEENGEINHVFDPDSKLAKFIYEWVSERESGFDAIAEEFSELSEFAEGVVNAYSQDKTSKQ